MDIRQLLLRALTDYKNNLKFVVPRLIEYALDFGIFLTFMILIALILGLAFRGFSYESLLRPFPNIPFTMVAVVLGGAALGFFLFMVVTAASKGALITMAVGTYKRGSTTLQEGWAGVKKYLPRIFLYLVFLLGAVLFVILLFALTISLLSGSSSIAAPFFVFFLTATALVGLLVVYIFTLFTPQVIAARDLGVVDGLKGSALFVRRNFGAIAAYGGVVFVVSLGVGIFMSALFFIINEITRYNQFLNLVAKIFQNILAFTVGLIISPYFEIVKTYMVLEAGEDGRTGTDKEEEDEGTAGES